MNSLKVDTADDLVRFPLSAILGGVVFSTAVGILLSLFGLSAGVTVLDPDFETLKYSSIGFILWTAVAGTFAMYVGGMLTGFLACAVNKYQIVAHTLIMWSATFLLGLFIITTGAEAFLTGSYQLIGQMVNINDKISQATKAVSEEINKQWQGGGDDQIFENAQRQLQKAVSELKSAAEENISKVIKASEKDDSLADTIQSYITNTNDSVKDKLYSQAVKQITKGAAMDRQQAEHVLNKWKEKYDAYLKTSKEKLRQLQENLEKLTSKSTTTIGWIAFYTCLTMLLGAMFSVLGGLTSFNLCSKK